MNSGTESDDNAPLPESPLAEPTVPTFADWKNYIGPYATFLVLTTLDSWELLRPYYPWMYGLTIAIVAAVTWASRRAFPAWSWNGLGWGIIAGVLGVVLWVGLWQLALEERINQFLPSGLQMAERVGYNPWEEVNSPAGQIAFLAVRLVGMVLLVPLIEELFWRGCVWRYIQDENFTAVSWGVPSKWSIIGVTLLFASTHTEYITAIAWCMLINVLFISSRNLWSCIIAHAVTNLLLAIYILQSENWVLW